MTDSQTENDQQNTESTKRKQMTPDSIFSTFIHKTEVLSRILAGNVEELGDMVPEEIKDCLDRNESNPSVVNGRETIYKSPDGKRIELDSVFDVRIPDEGDKKVSVIVGVEGQYNPLPGYPIVNRSAFYLSAMLSSQKGTVFTGNDYGSLRNTYSIWCMLDPKKVDRNSIIRYGAIAKDPIPKGSSYPEEMGFFNAVFINLGDYAEGLPKPLEAVDVLFSKMENDDRKKLVQNKLNMALSDVEMEGLLKMSTLGQDKFDHGYSVGLDVGRAEGKEIGIAEGKEIGIAEGIDIGVAKGTINSMVNVLLNYIRNTGESLDTAFETLGIP